MQKDYLLSKLILLRRQAGPPGRNRRSILGRRRDYFLLHSAQMGFGTHQASHSIGTDAVDPGGNGRCLKLSTILHLI